MTPASLLAREGSRRSYLGGQKPYVSAVPGEKADPASELVHIAPDFTDRYNLTTAEGFIQLKRCYAWSRNKQDEPTLTDEPNCPLNIPNNVSK